MRDVELKPEVVGSSARLFGHFFAIHMEGTIEYTEAVPNERIGAKIRWFGERPAWVFTFQPADGGTKLTVEGKWHSKVPFVGSRLDEMMVKSHGKGLEGLLAAVKTRLEAEVAASV